MGMLVNTLVIGSIPSVFKLSWFLTFDVAIVATALLIYGMVMLLCQCSNSVALGRMAYEREKEYLLYAFWVMQLIIPAYLIYCFLVFKEIFASHPRSENPGKEAAITEGYQYLFFGSGLLLLLSHILVVVTSIMLYQYFGEGIKNIPAQLKRQKLLIRDTNGRDSRLSTQSRGSRADLSVASLLAGRGSEGGSLSGFSGEDGEEGQQKQIFYEIFQNTLEKAHHVGSVDSIGSESSLFRSLGVSYEEPIGLGLVN